MPTYYTSAGHDESGWLIYIGRLNKHGRAVTDDDGFAMFIARLDNAQSEALMQELLRIDAEAEQQKQAAMAEYDPEQAGRTVATREWA